MHLTHLVGRHSPSLHGRLRLTSPRFSLYPGGASSKGRFVSTRGAGTLVLWRSSRASSRSPFSTACRLFILLAVSSIQSMVPWSTIRAMFSPFETLQDDLWGNAPR